MSVVFRRLVCLASLWACSAFPRPPSITLEELAKPPAGAQRYVLMSKAGQLGHSESWTLPDGTTMERESLLLRGQVFELESTTKLGPDGMPASFMLRGFTPKGDATETFSVANGTATWKSPFDSGSAPYASPSMYVPWGGVSISMALLVKVLIASPDKSVPLFPAGRARIERLKDKEIGDGARKIKLVCWSIDGLDTSPVPVWTTEDGTFWGIVTGLGVLPAGHEDAYQALRAVQDAALSERSRLIAHTLPRTATRPVAFVHVRAFVGGERFAEDQTVVVDKGVITAVGSAPSTPVPEGAQVIDGDGRTLVPGLWDSHHHVGSDAHGPFLLSLGITSVRDPGNDDDRTVARARRRMAGDVLMPHVYASSMIDGKGPYTAQFANVATSRDSAVALVQRAKGNGFTGIKFYGSLDPAWVAPAAAEAHRLGLHVHGHLPAGMRTSDAIKAGYDEVTHINFVMMEAMPDAVVKHSNGMERFIGVGRYARRVDLEAEPMKSLIALMRERHVAVDPTLVTFESILVQENGELSPAYAPYTGTLPPNTERGFLEGGFDVPADLTRADFRASFAKYVALVGRIHKAGVRVVAGTDGSGLELVRELELYVQAGFTPEEALAAATIEAARNVGVDGKTGTIAVGKAADVVLIEGDPSRRIGDLRNVRLVMMDGRLMDGDGLRTAAGFSGRPHGVR
jgi:imidazolonepropionase-like amidohydrolase